MSTSSRIRDVKIWGWFVIAALWLGLVAAAMLRGGLGVDVITGRWISQGVAMLVSALLMELIFWGWLIPLSIGFLRLVRTKLAR